MRTGASGRQSQVVSSTCNRCCSSPVGLRTVSRNFLVNRSADFGRSAAAISWLLWLPSKIVVVRRGRLEPAQIERPTDRSEPTR
jgi:hypothetical protein